MAVLIFFVSYAAKSIRSLTTMKLILAFVIASSVMFRAVGQEEGFHPGAIITKDNERIEGLVKNLQGKHVLDNIRFKANAESKTQFYAPTALRGYEINEDFYVSKKNADNQVIFVKKFNTGKLKLYGQLAYNGPSDQIGHEPYIQLEGDPVIRVVQQISFRAQMLDYLKDAPELCKLIKSRKLTWRDIGQIVDLYNVEVK
jgi:hypothetical protein